MLVSGILLSVENRGVMAAPETGQWSVTIVNVSNVCSAAVQCKIQSNLLSSLVLTNWLTVSYIASIFWNKANTLTNVVS